MYGTYATELMCYLYEATTDCILDRPLYWFDVNGSGLYETACFAWNEL